MRSALGRMARSPLLAVVLAATFPVFFLWAHNVDADVRVSDVLVVLAWTVGASLLVYAVVRAVLHDRNRAGIVTLLCQALVLSFGHVVDATTISPGTGRETLFVVAFLLAIVIGSVLIASRPRGDTAFRLVTPALAVLIAIDTVAIVRGGEVTPAQHVPTAAEDIDTRELDPEAVGPPRDVYYLIFDRYGGERTLRDLYGFDDRPFLDGLTDRGFAVLQDPVANYPQTTHSLASSLNMDYLDGLASTVGEGSSNWDPLYASLSDTTLSRTFSSMGYRYFHIGSWWGPTAIDPTADRNYTYGIVREFPETFLRTTMVAPVMERLPFGPDDPYEEQYHRVAYQLRSLEDIGRDPAATFTFAHFTLPHPPYVFDANGSYRPQADDTPIEQKYLDQLVFTNGAIDDLVDELLAGPDDRDPIIVVQSDEGPYPPELDTGIDVHFAWGRADDVELGRRFRILDALYLPDPRPTVPEHLTPVNTFRLILDTYFGASLPMLRDRSYVFVDHDHPYEFEDVTDRLVP